MTSTPDSAPPSLILSERDCERLEALLASPEATESSVADQLESELLRADVRAPSEVPANVVRMGSEVICVDTTSNAERRLRLVYPHEIDGSPAQVSVLAPVGAALLGLSVGQSIDWPLPGGRSTRLSVVDVAPPQSARH
jgi:regulator of nucleoside diphosphate kinase